VLTVCGLRDPAKSLSASEVQRRYDENIEARIVDLETGEYADDEVDLPYSMVAAARNPEMSVPAPPDNEAQVRRLPEYALVSQVMKDGEVDMLVLSVWGQGLWSTLYGYLALDNDTNTIRGLTFYQHGETPGLGGEVDNQDWKALWVGRKAFDEKWQPAIELVKGGAGSPDEDPHRVDALSGATITSRGVQHLVNFWLGDNGYGPYLEKFREGQI
jgi:Na+-transporting NADH:ubiquinone oxidoreductase subunit C